jgi:hypothetical protein
MGAPKTKVFTTKPQALTISKIENGFAFCECAETNEGIQVKIAHLPNSARVGDIIRKDDGVDGEESYVIDLALSKSHLTKLILHNTQKQVKSGEPE